MDFLLFAGNIGQADFENFPFIQRTAEDGAALFGRQFGLFPMAAVGTGLQFEECGGFPAFLTGKGHLEKQKLIVIKFSPKIQEKQL